MSRTAFVTGATGLLGTNLVRELVRERWRVKALARSRAKFDRLFHDIGGANVVDARDVAIAMIRSVELGRPGERYIVVGPAVSLEEIAMTLQRITGIPAAALFGSTRCRLVVANGGIDPRYPIAADRELWERYLSQILDRARGKLRARAGRGRDAASDEEDAALSAFDSLFAGVSRHP